MAVSAPIGRNDLENIQKTSNILSCSGFYLECILPLHRMLSLLSWREIPNHTWYILPCVTTRRRYLSNGMLSSDRASSCMLVLALWWAGHSSDSRLHTIPAAASLDATASNCSEVIAWTAIASCPSMLGRENIMRSPRIKRSRSRKKSCLVFPRHGRVRCSVASRGASIKIILANASAPSSGDDPSITVML